MTEATYETPLTWAAEIRADVWDASDKRCHYCGKELHPLRDFCVDHVTPKCAGGTDAPHNLVAACRPCNLRKGINEDRALCRRLRAEKRALLKDMHDERG